MGPGFESLKVHHRSYRKRQRRELLSVSVSNAKGPPVPIPNTEVKLCSGENTCLETSREDSSSPTLFEMGYMAPPYVPFFRIPCQGSAKPRTPRPAPHRAPAVRGICLLMLNTEPRRHTEPVFQRSTEPGNLFTHFIRLPPYAHLLSLGGTRNLPPYAQH